MRSLEQQVTCFHIMSERNIVEAMMRPDVCIRRITYRYRRPVRLKKQCEITFVADHGITDEQQHFMQTFTKQVVWPHSIQFSQCFEQVDRTILIFISHFSSGRSSCCSMYRCTIPLHVLEISFTHRIMAVFLHPHECFLRKMESVGIV